MSQTPLKLFPAAIRERHRNVGPFARPASSKQLTGLINSEHRPCFFNDLAVCSRGISKSSDERRSGCLDWREKQARSGRRSAVVGQPDATQRCTEVERHARAKGAKNKGRALV